MKCVTVSYGAVRGSARRWPYYQGAMYEAVEVGKNRVLKWKYIGHIGTARRSFALATLDAKEYARKHELDFLNGIRQWVKVETGTPTFAWMQPNTQSLLPEENLK